MIGYLQHGSFVWTFYEVERPELTDPHDLISVTAIEAISAAGEIIPSFLILPGVNIPVNWVKNDLDDGVTLTTSEKGYINDIVALEWIRHFELHTRPENPEEKRVLLMDNCESHFTAELVHFCVQNNIEVFPLPPKVTHLLQPLDVGVFQPYKHWHQEVLYREVADGAVSFNKADFLFHLQEIRNRTFKKSTILSAWKKCGFFPPDPSVVLDKLQDPLSSLTEVVDERDLPGFIEEGHTTPSNEPSSESSNVNFQARTPETIRADWKSASTPPFNLHILQRYNAFVQCRIESSVISKVPLTPSVTHVFTKAHKAGRALALNGILATREMRLIKRKALERTNRQAETGLIAKYGPITMGDARLRVARDEHNRRAAQDEEDERIFKRAANAEAAYLRRWNKKAAG
ncbi:hypothetical protein S7711_10316 [Stachybotrys chartarum IBT 7711]|uniref:DDE-1 domain-containing protein n=1 Tax=Stachybotrys chartarum (strain CBS 109288 / IBT 7711) TaxID=1280523 RepID=A0A084B5G3_STACB|nr:hypothetical protein S7711_10316 [Stachybotrys chartarum IBT 7711]